MVRLVLILLGTALAAFGLAWLADQPGTLVLTWPGVEIEMSVFKAVVMLLLLLGVAIVLLSILRQIWLAPASVGHFFNRRRQRRGLDALSSGLIAIGSGDRNAAMQSAVAARRALPDEPLTHLLRAQAAQLSGDRITSRRIFEAMLGAPETEVLGLRGLFLEAEREGETEVAKQFAERAVAANPKLAWSVDALFDLQAKSADWNGALKTLNVARKHGHIDKRVADRRRAVVLTAMAQAAEENESARALNLSLEAHALAPDLAPAAAIAGRLLASRGNPAKVAKVIQKTWRLSPHPELATAYAYSRPGDSPQDRLARVAQLAAIAPNSAESNIALASAAIEAREFDKARAALSPLLDGRQTQRVATLMARVEGEQHGDAGRVREWLARAVNAPRDPAWTADGRVSETWAPLSPVTRTLDAFEWRVPAEPVQVRDTDAIAAKLEELVSLGARREPAAAIAAPVTSMATAGTRNPATDVEPSPLAPRPAAHTPDVAHAVAPAPAMAARVEPSAAAAVLPTPVMAERREPPRPAYASSLVKKKPSTTPRLTPEPSATGKAPSAAEVDALAAAIAVKQPVTESPIREAAAAASAALAARASAAPTVALHTVNGQSVAASAKKPVTAAKPAEPKIYVAPRAPDDPGPEPAAGTTGRTVRGL